MKKGLHSTLGRQLAKLGFSKTELPDNKESWSKLLARISSAYHQADEDRYTLERSLDISSKEMGELYESLRESSETLLAKERDKLKTIVSTLGEGLCVTSDDGTISFINPEASNILERSEEDVIGKEFTSFIIDNHNTPGINQLTLAQLDKKYEGEAKINGGSKGLVPIHFTITPLSSSLNNQVIGAVIIFRDISEQKKIEVALKDARDKAVEASKMKSEFLATMSHEIRTPLNVVLGSTELLSYSDLDEEQREDVETIQESIEQLKQIIDEVLDFSKIEAGKLFIDAKSFSFKQLAKTLENQAHKLSKDKDIEIEMILNEEIPPYLHGDSLRIKQIATNLLGNAIKFTPDKGKVSISIGYEKLTPETGKLMLSITDTGIGIKKEKLDVIFEKFSQADNSITREFGGTGLGLAICAGLVHLMGGEIWVESTPGKGSKFSFSLTLKISDEVSEDPVEKVAQKKLLNKEYKDLSILLAEDNKGNQNTISRLLEMNGHNVVIANNGQEAIDILNEQYAEKKF